MKADCNLNTTIMPKKDKKIDYFNKRSKYLVKVITPDNFSETLFTYAENYYQAAHLITEFILNAEHPSIAKLDTYFFAIAFLYRHCMEVGLKAIGFQCIEDIEGRKEFVKTTRHNLTDILNMVGSKCDLKRPEEMEWLKKYFASLSQKDRESDSFRYPFHIVWESNNWKSNGKFVIKTIFNEQTHIDLVKFANKFQAAYEIIRKWYLKESDSAVHGRS